MSSDGDVTRVDAPLVAGRRAGLQEALETRGQGILADGRLYHLVRERDAVRERTLAITFLDAGAEAYALTFG